MCFRPADAGGGAAMSCPECGKPVQPMPGGMVMKKCPFCKADWSPYLNPDGTPNMDAIAAKQGGGAPGAPAAPGAPVPPPGA